MSDETKTPQAGKWWVHDCGRIRFIVGKSSKGSVIIEENGMVGVARGWDNWHYEPRCTGFDWVAPPAIDPGDGWELLPIGTVIDERDEYSADGKEWWPTQCAGEAVQPGNTYRRRKPTAEVWPKYAVGTGDKLYRADSWSRVVWMQSADNEFVQADPLYYRSRWPEFKQLTEAEALARVKPADPLPALIPGIATDRMVDLFLSWRLPSDFQPDGGISFTSRPIHESWPTGTNLFTATQARGMIEHLLSVPGETSRVQPAEPVDAERIPDKRPARDVVMEIVKLLADSSMTDEESADMAFRIGNQWLADNPEEPAPFAKPFTSHRSGMGIRKDAVAWRPNGQRHEVATEVTYRAETPVESPDDWIEITDPEHVLRRDVDQFYNSCGKWELVEGYGGAELRVIKSGKARCRRKDLPPVESPDDWVEITDPEHVLREGIDEVWYSFKDMINEWQQVFPSAGMRLNDSQYKRARCRRRDLPAQPAPIDHERWFMWSDDRYPIAFVKRAGGKVFNLNVDGMFKTSDDWGASYEEKLINGEMIEVTEESAKAYLKRPRRKIIDPPAPQPKRIPVRLWCLKNNVQNVGSGVIACVENPDSGCDMWQEIKFDGSGFYVEGGE